MADGRFKKKEKRATRRKNRGSNDEEEEEEEKQASVDNEKKEKGKRPTRRMTRRRTASAEGEVTQPPPPENDYGVPVFVKFAKWATELKVEGLTKIFKELNKTLPSTISAPSFEANPDKNRDKDVVCLEETRVKLTKENPNDTDYIHANWVKLKDSDRAYIVTQGPLESTIEDFWRMVWQEQSSIIVNLTKCFEDGKAKCAQYWPEAKEGASKKFGCITVKMKKVDIEEGGKLPIYHLELLHEGCSNKLAVHLLHTLTWPEDNVMHTSAELLRLIRQIFKIDPNNKSPIVIHSSKGIGRTGTFILTDYILYSIYTSKQVTLKDAFLELRSQRALSIRTENQFIFIVVATMAYIGCRSSMYYGNWKHLEAEFNCK